MPTPSRPPTDSSWGHGFGRGEDGVRLHYVRRGSGPPVVLLHGWPGFWYDWRRVLPLLEGELDLLALDLRGFGDSDKPDLVPVDGYTPLALAGDVVALLDELKVGRVVLAAHDLGATVAQTLARTAPARVAGLVLLNPPYPGIGERRLDPALQAGSWYQHFQALPLAAELVGHDWETVRLYLSHFYREWLGRPEALPAVELEAIVNAYAKPGAIRAAFAYYQARAETLGRLTEASVSPDQMQIDLPAAVLWGDRDPILPVQWADRIPEYFPRAQVSTLGGVGHFVPFEAPEEVAEAIREVVRAAQGETVTLRASPPTP